MFTGIIQTMAQVAWVKPASRLLQYALILPEKFLHQLNVGASISVQGVCQTVVNIEGAHVAFDAIEETLKRTSIADFKPQQRVNIERCAKFGDEIGGHILSGHIIGFGKIHQIQTLSSEQRIVTIECSPSLMKYIFAKGYIALDGASLTVVDTDPQGRFTVHLIPETLRLTTFGQAQVGDKVNIEIDSQTQAIVETVERVLATHSLST